MQWASLYGSHIIVQRLLSAGADPNFRNRNGHVPLYYAVRNRQEQCVVALIKAGAVQENVDGQGKSAVALSHESPLKWTETLGYSFSGRRKSEMDEETPVKDWAMMVTE